MSEPTPAKMQILEAEIDLLEAENQNLNEQLARITNMMADRPAINESLFQTNRQLTKERDRLEAALEKYGQHDDKCRAYSCHAPCDCGLSALQQGSEEDEPQDKP